MGFFSEHSVDVTVFCIFISMQKFCAAVLMTVKCVIVILD